MGWMILQYIIFIAWMVFLFSMNKMIRKTFFAVSNYLIITFSVITAVQVLACSLLGYKRATIDYWIILASFITVSVIVDYLGCLFARRVSFNGVRLKASSSKLYTGMREKQIDILCVILAMYSILHFFRLAGGEPNIYYIVQEDFQTQYASGLNFYIRVFMMIAAAYYLGCSKVSKKNILLGLLCMVPNMLTFVKGIVFIPILGGILLRIRNGQIRISLGIGIKIAIAGVGVFFGVYLVEMGVYNPHVILEPETYKVISSKLIDYLIAGVQSFSQNISEDNIAAFRRVDNVTLAPFVNALAKVGIGESIGTLSTIFQKIGVSSLRNAEITSNVNTYIGTLYLYNGFILGNLLNLFWTFLASFLDEVTSERSDILTALSSLFAAAFALGWFEYYFMQTFWLYLIIIGLLIAVVFKMKLHVKQVRSKNYLRG